MSDKFKKIAAAQQRASIPKVDPEKVMAAMPQVPALTTAVPVETEPAREDRQPTSQATPTPERPPLFLTSVDSSEKAEGWGIHGYPSRKKQVNDLAYHTGKKPWRIVEDALDEHIVRHYGKEHKRR